MFYLVDCILLDMLQERQERIWLVRNARTSSEINPMELQVEQ